MIFYQYFSSISKHFDQRHCSSAALEDKIPPCSNVIFIPVVEMFVQEIFCQYQPHLTLSAKLVLDTL